jgi:hypothetical protein
MMYHGIAIKCLSTKVIGYNTTGKYTSTICEFQYETKYDGVLTLYTKSSDDNPDFNLYTEKPYFNIPAKV